MTESVVKLFPLLIRQLILIMKNISLLENGSFSRVRIFSRFLEDIKTCNVCILCTAINHDKDVAFDLISPGLSMLGLS